MKAGGNVAILDMNEELAATLVAEYPKSTKFFQTNVLETESIAAAVKGSLEWIKETGYELGGVVAAAGVSTPAKVMPPLFHHPDETATNCHTPRSSTGTATPSPSTTSTSS